MNTVRLTMTQVIEAFPEGFEIIPEKIAEWLAVKDRIKEEIRDKIRQYRNSKDYWLIREIIKQYDIPGIKTADKHIIRSRTLKQAYAGKLPKKSITDADIEAALQVPIENLYEGKLRRTGNNLIGLCPFHSEKHASFQIYRKSNSFFCFGCQKGGNSITFVKNLFGLDFVQAVKQLTYQN